MCDTYFWGFSEGGREGGTDGEGRLKCIHMNVSELIKKNKFYIQIYICLYVSKVYVVLKQLFEILSKWLC